MKAKRPEWFFKGINPKDKAMKNISVDFGQRKVQGGNEGRCFSVHLPTLWVRSKQIKRGDTLHIGMDNEGNLIIKKPDKEAPNE